MPSRPKRTETRSRRPDSNPDELVLPPSEQLGQRHPGGVVEFRASAPGRSAWRAPGTTQGPLAGFSELEKARPQGDIAGDRGLKSPSERSVGFAERFQTTPLDVAAPTRRLPRFEGVEREMVRFREPEERTPPWGLGDDPGRRLRCRG